MRKITNQAVKKKIQNKLDELNRDNLLVGDSDSSYCDGFISNFIRFPNRSYANNITLESWCGSQVPQIDLNTLDKKTQLDMTKRWTVESIKKQWPDLDEQSFAKLVVALQKLDHQNAMGVPSVLASGPSEIDIALLPSFVVFLNNYSIPRPIIFSTDRRNDLVWDEVNQKFLYRITGRLQLENPRINLGLAVFDLKVTENGLVFDTLTYENPLLADLLNSKNPDEEYQKQFNLLKQAILDHQSKQGDAISPEDHRKNIQLLIEYIGWANEAPRNAELVVDFRGLDIKSGGEDLGGLFCALQAQGRPFGKNFLLLDSKQANWLNAQGWRIAFTAENLSQTDLRNKNLSGMDLQSVQFVDANCTKANLTNTNLANANLSNTTLTNATISNTTKLTNTILNDVHCEHFNWDIFGRNNQLITSLVIATPTNQTQINFLDEFKQQLRSLNEKDPFLKELALFQDKNKDFGTAVLFIKQHINAHPNSNAALAARRAYYKAYKAQEQKKLTLAAVTQQSDQAARSEERTEHEASATAPAPATPSSQPSVTLSDRLSELQTVLGLSADITPREIFPIISDVTPLTDAENAELKSPQAKYNAHKAKIQACLPQLPSDEKTALVESLLELAEKLGVKKDLSQLDLSGTDLSLLDLRDVNLSGSNLFRVNFDNATFNVRTNLSHARFCEQIKGTHFNFYIDGHKIEGLSFSEVNLSKGKRQDSATEALTIIATAQENPSGRENQFMREFLSEKLDESLNQTTAKPKITITGKQLADLCRGGRTDFTGFNIVGDIGKLHGKDGKLLPPDTLNFTNADLSEAKFEYFETYQQINTLQNAKLNRSQVVHLTAGGLANKHKKALLKGADLSGLDLRGVNLSQADLRGADFRGADLDDAQLVDAQFNENTRLDARTRFSASLSDTQLKSLIPVDTVTAASQPKQMTPIEILKRVIADIEIMRRDATASDIEKLTFAVLPLSQFFNAILGAISDTNKCAGADDFMPIAEEIFLSLDSNNKKVVEQILQQIVDHQAELVAAFQNNGGMGYQLANCGAMLSFLQQSSPQALGTEQLAMMPWDHQKRSVDAHQLNALINKLAALLASPEQLTPAQHYRYYYSQEILLENNVDPLRTFKKFNAEFDQFLTQSPPKHDANVDDIKNAFEAWKRRHTPQPQKAEVLAEKLAEWIKELRSSATAHAHAADNSSVFTETPPTSSSVFRADAVSRASLASRRSAGSQNKHQTPELQFAYALQMALDGDRTLPALPTNATEDMKFYHTAVSGALSTPKHTPRFFKPGEQEPEKTPPSSRPPTPGRRTE